MALGKITRNHNRRAAKAASHRWPRTAFFIKQKDLRNIRWSFFIIFYIAPATATGEGEGTVLSRTVICFSVINTTWLG